jgi:hypothetical protein
MTIQNQIKNLKPTDCDITLRYVCPNCSNEHWVRLKQAKYEKFVIVCDCDTILKTKPITSVKILYRKKKSQSQKKEKQITDQQEEIDSKLIDKCFSILSSYGFSRKETESLVKECYIESKNTDCLTLVKLSLSKFGEQNGKCNPSV